MGYHAPGVEQNKFLFGIKQVVSLIILGIKIMNWESGAFLVDVLILLWLVITWFYEGHHKKCKVTVTCNHCGQENDQPCHSKD